MIIYFGLKITITANLKTVNFFDVTFNLCTRKYQPYKKQNAPTYISVNSNRPPNIIKALPDNISHLSIRTYCLRVGTKKITLVNKI